MFTVYTHYTLLIAFNSADWVVKFTKTSSWGRYYENVREQALNWFKKLEMQDLAFTKAPAMLVRQVIPPGESALYIYREGGI